jgi:hypothetical protein
MFGSPRLTILRDWGPKRACALVKKPVEKNTGDLQGVGARQIQERSLKWRRKRRERRTGE